MGCVPSIDEQPTISNLKIDRSHKSLVEFVRSLSGDKPSSDYIKNIEELTPKQEEFLSRYKMQVLGRSDPIARRSVFNMIESEFYEECHKRISRSVLYEVYGINC